MRDTAKKILKLRRLVKAFKNETKDHILASYVDGYLNEAYDAKDCFEIYIGFAKERIAQRIEILTRDAENNGEEFIHEAAYIKLLEEFETI